MCNCHWLRLAMTVHKRLTPSCSINFRQRKWNRSHRKFRRNYLSDHKHLDRFYQPGKKNATADVLYCSPSSNMEPSSTEAVCKSKRTQLLDISIYYLLVIKKILKLKPWMMPKVAWKETFFWILSDLLWEMRRIIIWRKDVT